MWTLVTGGAKRLGEAICLSLAEKGRNVVVHYNKSGAEADEVVRRCRAMGCQSAAIQGDFQTMDGTMDFAKRYLQEFPETDVLINNVGNYLVSSALQTSVEDWVDLFQANLHAPFILMKALAPSLIRNKGQIINIGACGLHRHSANTYCTCYALTKQSLWGLTLSIARELAEENVRVNMISPGELDISVDHRKIPMQRPASCHEVCRVVDFLLDPQSAYLTGQNIEVAGGLGLA